MSKQRPASQADIPSEPAVAPIDAPLVTAGIPKSATSEPEAVAASVGHAVKDGAPSEHKDNPLPEFVHQYLRDYISLADQKAGFVFAAVSAILAYLVSQDVLVPLKSYFAGGSALSAGNWISLLAVAALAVSAGLAIWVVAPRLYGGSPKAKGFIFWKDICSFPDVASYDASLERLTPAAASQQIRAHCYVLARICNQKYDRLNWAIWTGSIAFFLTALSLLLAT